MAMDPGEPPSFEGVQRSFDELRLHLDSQFAQQAQLLHDLFREAPARRRFDSAITLMGLADGGSAAPSEFSQKAPVSEPVVESIRVPSEETVEEQESEAGDFEVKAPSLKRRPRASVATLMRHIERKEAEAQKPHATGHAGRRVKACTRALVEATSFNVAVFFLILLNAILLGVEIDVASTVGEADIPPWLGLLNAVIVGVFVMEIVLKLVAYGCDRFWRGPQAWWNAFDFGIVLISALETVLDLWARSLVSSLWGSDAFSVVRTMRLARALRGMRFLRVFRYFSALRVLVLSIVSTMSSLLWTMVLLFVIFYSFGVILTQLVTDYCRYLAVQARNDVNAVPECPAELQRFWSSIGQSMLTLFYAITNGLAWSEAVHPLMDVSIIAVAFVIFYIIISVFTLLNVVTGVFVNTAIERASADKDIAALKAFQKRKEQIHTLQKAFEALDHAHTNKLQLQDIEQAFGLESVGSFLESLDISTDDIRMLFTLIDADNSGTIDLEEFVSGCMQLHGPAKSLQLAKMSYENKWARETLNNVNANLRTLLAKTAAARPPAVVREDL